MKNRMTALLVCLLLLCPLVARAENMPSKSRFSVGLDAIQTAIRKGERVTWRFSAAPESIGNFDDGAMETLCAIVSTLAMEGSVQRTPEGGWMRISVLSSGKEVATVEQMTSNGIASVYLDGNWYADSMLLPNYETLAEGRIPYVSLVYDEGYRLWALASPWCEDNNRLSVPSGATSHGLTYTIDTAAMREIMTQWLDELQIDMRDLPLVRAEWVDELVGKLRHFAQTAELSKPLVANLAFGMGDLLRTVRARGTVEQEGKRDGFSYSYNGSESNTRITRKYSLDFQPRVGDTLIFSCTWLTSCSGSGRAAREITISASGKYNGESYRIKWTSEMLNRYQRGEDGVLSELLTGTVSASVRYAGEPLLEISLKRNGEATSSQQGLPGYTDTYTGTIKSREETLFKGAFMFAAEVEDDAEPLPAAPALDERLLEGEQEALDAVLADLRAGMIAGLPQEVMQMLLAAY